MDTSTTAPIILPSGHRWLTEDETAEVLHNSVATLRRWRSQGTGPRHAKSGRTVLYRAGVVELWLLRSMEAA